MSLWNNRTVYALIACGPLKKRLSEHDACYDALSNAEIPCSNESKRDTKVLKVCRWLDDLDRNEEPVRNVTYTCGSEGSWEPRYAACQLDCGKSTRNNKYPWIVAIYDQEELKCTGTIISAYHVVTDSSCLRYSSVHNLVKKIEYKYVDMSYASNYTIVAGKHYGNIHRKHKSAQIRKIKKATIGTKVVTAFGWLHGSDIALLEVDSEFDFFNDVQPACIDWDNYYEKKDLNEGNEAVAVDWSYNKSEMVPCADSNEFNVQIWDYITCDRNSKKIIYTAVGICGTYINGSRSNCVEHIGGGLFFKSNPWRYYLRGITRKIITEPEVTYGLYTTVSLHLPWLKSEMISHPNLYNLYFTWGVGKDETGCILPEHVKYGRFKLILGEAFRPGAWVSTRTRILLTCTAKTDVTVSTYCNSGQWQPPIEQLECKRPGICPALSSSSSEDVICRNKGQTIRCAEPENNTTAVIRCKPFYAISGNKPIYKCKDSEWDQPLTRCTLECGTKRVGVTTLIVGGSEVIQNEYPWVAAVYRTTEQICSGTIISKSYVLSAAHCFTTSNGTARDKESYTIFAGKHYRNFSAAELSAQSRKIKVLHIHDDYRGILQKYRDDIALIEVDAEWIPTLEVQPACVDWDNIYEDFDFADGNNAVVTGWGYTKQSESSSEVLKKLVVPYRPKDACIANLPNEFSHQYVVEDKICAGNKDINMNVCQGDSGGGLCFQSYDKRYYVRGIVSLVPKTLTNSCEINKFALYTKVSKYLQWMETIVRRVL